MHSVCVFRHRRRRRRSCCFFLRQPHGGTRGTEAEIALVVRGFVLRVKDEMVEAVTEVKGSVVVDWRQA